MLIIDSDDCDSSHLVQAGEFQEFSHRRLGRQRLIVDDACVDANDEVSSGNTQLLVSPRLPPCSW